MRKAAWVLLVVMAMSVSGCAQKTENEKLADQLKKVSNQMKRDSQKAANDMKREMDKL